MLCLFNTKLGYRASAGVLCALLLLTGSALAQQQQGSIFGSVSDESGAFVPGVSVEITAASLIRPLTSVTDETGAFRFPALPPGQYTVKASMPGFAAYVQEGIDLNLGRALKVDIKLKVSGVAETVEVSATAPIDVVKSESVQTLNSDLVDRIPKGRDYSTIAKMNPGINNERGGINVDGASAAENVFVVDGVDTTDMYDGASQQAVPLDFVEEMQIKTGGYEAEYGGAMGGVISVVTKSGGNNFHGEVLYNFWGDKLNGGNRDRLRINPTDDVTAEYVAGEPEDKDRYHEFGFSLGGPILKDKLWFFGMYLPRMQNVERDVTFLTDGKTRQYGIDRNTHFANFKLSSQATSKVAITGSYNVDWYRTLGELPGRDGTGNPNDNWLEKGARQPNYTYSGQVDYMATTKMLFTTRGGYFFSDDVQLGGPDAHRWRMVGRIDQFSPPADLLVPNNWQNISNGQVRQRSIRDRQNFSTDGAFFFNGAGEHNLKVGYQFNKIHNDVANSYKNDYMMFYWNQAYRSNFSDNVYKGTYGYLRLVAGPENPYGEQAEVQSGRHAIFVQDAWRPTRDLTINAGLRMEKEDIPSFSNLPEYAGTAIAFSFNEKLAPRLGAAYDVFGNSKFKIFGSWGKFYDVMKLDLANGSFGGFKWKDRYYTLNSLDWKSFGGGNYTVGGGQFIEEIDWRIPSFETLDPDLQPMRMQEFIAGGEYLLAKDWVFSTRFIHKQLDRAIEDVGIETPHGEMYFITNPGFGYSVSKMMENGFPGTPKASRNYNAMEFNLSKRFSQKWQGRFNYTYSRLRGLYSGLGSSDEEGRLDPNVNRDFDGWWLSYDANMNIIDGPLQTDRPHQFKFYGFYQTPWNMELGVFQSVLSGRPFTRQIEVNNMQTMVANRGSDGRLPTISQTDLAITQNFRIGESKAIQVEMNIVNLFNQDQSTNLFRTMTRETIIVDMHPGQPYDYKAAMAEIAAEEDNFMDTRFGKADEFQAPIAARFSLRFKF